MLKYAFAKLLMGLAAWVMVGIPFFCLSLVYHSYAFVVASVGVALVVMLVFSWGGFDRKVNALKARPSDPDTFLGRSTQKWSKVSVWEFSDPEARTEFWLKSRNELVLLISHGSLSDVSAEQLNQMYQKGQFILKSSRLRYALALEQDEWTIGQFLARIKGRNSEFRYWFFSFWLLPFEKTLNYAVHLLS